MLKHFYCAALFLSSPALADTQKLKTVVGKIYGDITISEVGMVSAVTFNNIKDAKIAALLESQVKKWEFHPMLVNGRPQLAEAGFSMDIFITQDLVTNKTTEIVLDDVTVMPTVLELSAQEKSDTSKRFYPQYPSNAYSMNLGARLNVAVEINADGSVERAAVKEFAYLNFGKGSASKVPAYVQKEFSERSINAAKKWRISESAMRRNDCVGGCISLMRFEFIVEERPWYVYHEVKTPNIDWYPTNHPKNDISTTKSQLVRFKVEPSNQPIEIGG